MKRLACLVLLAAAACVHQPQPVPVDPIATGEPPVQTVTDAEARAVTEQFVAAAEKRDFATVYALLSGALRDRYTPDRLARDFDAEPLASERLARIRAALGQPFSMGDKRATLSLGERNQLALVKEGDVWRVAAVE